MNAKERVLEAAMIVFARYGYRQTSMELVAQELGVTRQALYRHFPTKEAIFEAAVETLQAEGHEAAVAAGRAAANDGRDLWEILFAQIAARYGHFYGRLQGSAHGNDLLAESSQQCEAIVGKFRRRFIALLVASIEEAQGRGIRLAKESSAEDVARFLMSAARGIQGACPPPSPGVFRRELAGMTRLIVVGAMDKGRGRI